MLVLSRREDEEIIINGDIVIKIVHVDRGKVRVGIIAPKEVPVHRKEVWDEIKKQEQESANHHKTISETGPG